MSLLPAEDLAEYTEHCEGILAVLDPGSPLEDHLAQAIADDYWRIARIRRLEQLHINRALEAGAEPDPRTLSLYSTYETRLNRNIKSNTVALRNFQSEREQLEFHQQRAALPRTPATSPNGFGFSNGVSPVGQEVGLPDLALAKAAAEACRQREFGTEHPMAA